MDSVRDLVRRRLDASGLTMSEASKRIGKNHAYLQQFLERGIPRILPEDVREKLALLLTIPQGDLKLGRDSGRQNVKYMVPSLPPGINQKLPVLGMAEGGPDGSYQWNGQVIEYIDTPPYLAGAVDAYAVYVTGTSMEPRYEPGATLYIHPGKPVTTGCFVLVQLRPRADGEAPRALLKRLAKKTGTKLVLEQFSPPCTREVPLADVISIHRIVGSSEP